MKTLEELRDLAIFNRYSCAGSQYTYAKSLQTDAVAAGNPISDEDAWEQSGRPPGKLTASPAVEAVKPLPAKLDDDALIIAFVQGAQWWEWYLIGATMFPSDRVHAEDEARIRAFNGTLGKVKR